MLGDFLDQFPLQQIRKSAQLGMVLLRVRSVGVGNGIDGVPVDEEIGWSRDLRKLPP
jgi:hypothetical protein